MTLRTESITNYFVHIEKKCETFKPGDLITNADWAFSFGIIVSVIASDAMIVLWSVDPVNDLPYINMSPY